MQTPCPCGSPSTFDKCCGPLIAGEAIAATAEQLMRSRYSAYVMADERYLLASWHAGTRPASLDLGGEPPAKWLGLQVKRHVQDDASHARVEFVARYKVAGRAYRLHEMSRFVLENGRWYYVDGDVREP